MITKNFKRWISVLLQAYNTSTRGYAEVKNSNGSVRYLPIFYASNTIFPTSVSNVLRGSGVTSGVWIGNGTAIPTEEDYTLTSRIIDNNISSTRTELSGIDQDGNPFLKLTYIINNNSAADITITEVGYFQVCNASSSLNSATMNAEVIMFDHTLLDSPITIPANGNGVLVYTIKAII